MAGLERGFNDFQIGDNPYELGNQAVRRLADLSEIELSDQPDPDEIQTQLFDNWGTAKAFRANVDTFRAGLGVDEDEARVAIADIVEESGVTEAIKPRNVLGEEVEAFDIVVVAAGTLNWMRRRTQLVTDLMDEGYGFRFALFLGGDRTMDTPTEVDTPFVTQYRETHDGEFPTEEDYLMLESAPALGERDLASAMPSIPKEVKGFKAMVNAAAHFFDGKSVLLAQNAPAGSTFGDMRGVVHDRDLFYATDRITVARTAEEEADPAHFQNAFSAPSAMARWVKTVYEINKSHQA